MDFTHLRRDYNDLISYLESDGYTQSYIRRIKEDIRWIFKNESGRHWQSYIDIYNDRVSQSKSKQYKRNQRLAFGAIQQFDLYGEYPNRRIKNCFIKRGAYYQLVPEFKELLDFYQQEDILRGLKTDTVKGNASAAASFLYAMQNKGLRSLYCIEEEDVLSSYKNLNSKI